MFQHRNELYRRNCAVKVIFPADEGFHALELFGIGIHDRLIAEIKTFAVFGNAVPDDIELFDNEPVFVIEGICKDDSFTEPTAFGFIIDIFKAGIDSFLADVERIQLDNAGIQGNADMFLIDIEIMGDFFLESVVDNSKLFGGKVTADDSKLCAVHTVDIAPACKNAFILRQGYRRLFVW